MGDYLAYRIKKGKLNYNSVIEKYPEFKEEIDLKLSSEGYIVNEDGTVTKA